MKLWGVKQETTRSGQSERNKGPESVTYIVLYAYDDDRLGDKVMMSAQRWSMPHHLLEDKVDGSDVRLIPGGRAPSCRRPFPVSVDDGVVRTTTFRDALN